MMETFLLVVGFIVACVAGIAWDYYKPSRFRSGYHNVDKNRHDGGHVTSDSHRGGEGCYTSGSFGDGGDGGGD